MRDQVRSISPTRWNNNTVDNFKYLHLTVWELKGDCFGAGKIKRNRTHVRVLRVVVIVRQCVAAVWCLVLYSKLYNCTKRHPQFAALIICLGQTKIFWQLISQNYRIFFFSVPLFVIVLVFKVLQIGIDLSTISVWVMSL